MTIFLFHKCVSTEMTMTTNTAYLFALLIIVKLIVVYYLIYIFHSLINSGFAAFHFQLHDFLENTDLSMKGIKKKQTNKHSTLFL